MAEINEPREEDVNEWSGRHGVVLSQCLRCTRWRISGRCEAFPDGIPMPILANEFDHTNQYAEELLLFEPIS